MKNSKKLETFKIENPKKENDNIVQTFKGFLKMILKFKLEFDRKYFEKEIERNKFMVNLNLEIILCYLQDFKKKELENIDTENDSFQNIKNNSLIGEVNNSQDSSSDSICQESIQLQTIKKTNKENLSDNFEKFERIIEILIKISPEDLFKEVKSLILNEYESTTNEIKSYLVKNKNEASKKIFTTISQHILFILSNISFKLDYYTIAVNSLIEKLNRFFIEFVESTADSKEFVKSIDLVQKFVKIKKTFMKDFCETKEKLPDNYKNKIFSNVTFNRFCSFGRYFFNNLLSLLDMNINIDTIKDIELKDKNFFSIYKYKYKKSEKRGFQWKNYIRVNISNIENNYLDKYFRLYFRTKLATWKYSTIQAGTKKQEICRICETNFTINEFVLHMFFCKEQRVNNQHIIEIKTNLKKALEDLNIYRESLLDEKTTLKDRFFSPKAEFNQKFRLHMVDKTPKILNKKLEASQNQFFQFNNKLASDLSCINKNKLLNTNPNSEVEFLDRIIQTISKEKDLSREYYEKYPYKLSQLISIVHFTIYIFFQNKNSLTYSETLNKIFSILFISLMKKLTIVENILSLKDSKEKARMKVRNICNSMSTVIPNNLTSIAPKNIKNLELDKNIFSKKKSNLTISNKDDSIINVNNSNLCNNTSYLNTTGSNPMSSIALGKKDSMNSICDIIDLTKSKLLTKRPLNTNLESAHKNYLFSLSTKGVIPILNKKQNLVSPLENFVTAVSSDLKNLTKISKGEISERSYFPNINEDNISTTINNNSNLNNLPNQDKLNLFRSNLHSRNIPKLQKIINNNDNPSNSPWCLNKNNSDLDVGNSNILSTPSLLPNKIFINNAHNNLNRKSLFDKTPSPFILNNLQNKNSSSSNIKSDIGSTDLTTNNLNDENNRFSKIDITNDHHYSMIGEDSYVDSEISFSRETRKINKEENYINNEMDEVDSQFDEMIELMDDIQLSDPYREVEIEHSPREKNLMKISDFKIVMDISSGGYGRVDLYKKISTGDLYAIKTVDIHKMRTKNISGLLKNETIIMNEIYSDFVVKCYYIFNDEKNYYYAMEYLPGGDLFNFIQENEITLPTIQFIVAEVILALRYLHSKNIIHRDIKPENIIISNDGHFKLTDFGISESGLQHNKNVITNCENYMDYYDDEFSIDPDKILGTENYMAPEVISDKEITSETDFWSLGVLIYDLFTAKTPFFADNVGKIFENILNLNIDWSHFNNIETPDEDAKDLIKKFLVLNPKERWGDKNFEQIKSHKFFKDFDWDNLKQMRNPLVLHHVAERVKKMRQTKPSSLNVLVGIKDEGENKLKNVINLNHKYESENNSMKNFNVLVDDNFKNNFKLFCTERIDNLSKKNQDVLNINLKNKKIDLYTDDQNFTDFMNDLD